MNNIRDSDKGKSGNQHASADQSNACDYRNNNNTLTLYIIT